MDGGTDFKHHFGLSGEGQSQQVIVDENGIELKASEIAALNISKREYQKLYMDYWNDTMALTGTGRPVDGVLCPLAPHAAVIPGQYKHVGYTSFVNVLDYTSVSIPVTFADKEVDVRKPDNGLSEAAYIEWDCKWIPTVDITTVVFLGI